MKCDCGHVRILLLNYLKQLHRRGCSACSGRGSTAFVTERHGLAGTPEYKVWLRMKQRCSNPKNRGYHNYGGRGIRVCERWTKSFVAFFEDMGARPSNKHSIDRIDVNGNYEPGNCRWATPKIQARNTRKNRYLTVRGETKTMIEWSELTGVNYGNFEMSPEVRQVT